MPALGAVHSSLARPSHVSDPSLLHVWCQVDHLCVRRTDTDYTHWQSSVCISRYQYFSLVTGGPYRPRTKTPQSALLPSRLCSTVVSMYKARKLCPRKVFKHFLLCGRLSVSMPGCGLGGFPVSVRRRSMWAVLTACLPRRDPPPGGCGSLHPDHACWA